MRLETRPVYSYTINSVKCGCLQQACRGLYVLPDAQSFDAYTIEHITKALGLAGTHNKIACTIKLDICIVIHYNKL